MADSACVWTDERMSGSLSGAEWVDSPNYYQLRKQKIIKRIYGLMDTRVDGCG